MRHVAQLVGGTTNRPAHDLLLGGYVEHFVANLQTPTRRLDVADHHVLRPKRFPVAIDDLATATRHADHVLPRYRLEGAGVTQVVADDLGHVFRQDGSTLPAERNHGDRNRPIGTTGHDDVFLLRHCHACQAAQQDK